VSLHRPANGSDPLDPASRGSASLEERRESRSTTLASGSLSCPRCDAPPLPPARVLSPQESIGCGFCRHEAPVRDFLTLGGPSRPTVVTVRVRTCAPLPRRRRPATQAG
jgi:hypothetical protein